MNVDNVDVFSKNCQMWGKGEVLKSGLMNCEICSLRSVISSCFKVHLLEFGDDVLSERKSDAAAQTTTEC